MTDTLRDIPREITEVLNENWVPSRVVYGTDEPDGFSSVRGWAAHVAEAILAIPGIAVVELPPHDTSGPFAEWRVVADRSTVVWTAAQGRVMIQNVEPGDLTADEARDLAAELLAAADYAERDQ